VRDLVAGSGLHGLFTTITFISGRNGAGILLDPDAHFFDPNPMFFVISRCCGSACFSGYPQNSHRHSRRLNSFCLFEIGLEIQSQAEGAPREISAVPRRFSRARSGSAGLFELKRFASADAQCELKSCGGAEIRTAQRSGVVSWRGESIGAMFETFLHRWGWGPRCDSRPRWLSSRSVVINGRSAIKRCALPTSAFDLSVITSLREPWVASTALVQAPASIWEIELWRHTQRAACPRIRRAFRIV